LNPKKVQKWLKTRGGFGEKAFSNKLKGRKGGEGRTIHIIGKTSPTKMGNV